MYNNSYARRAFFALAIDINGKTTCVTRFIRPIEPPKINSDGFDVTPDQCARYISMIPFTESNVFYRNVWLTTEVTLANQYYLRLRVSKIIARDVGFR